uniref:SCP domain-containing protein n=1 Tax=Megaselia scalaris TaxID=36166 RepID=T1GFN0_MEGSC
MADVVWDDELAYLAELNLRKCHLSHDKCIHTYRFLDDIIETALNGWFREFNFIDSSFIDRPPLGRSDLVRWGHFLEVVLDRNTHVGCAVMTFTERQYEGYYIIRMACNYAALYDGSSPIYVKGQPASNCAFGSNPQYPGLCKKNEPFDINYDEVYGPRNDRS